MQLHFTHGFGIETSQTHHRVCPSMSWLFSFHGTLPWGWSVGWWDRAVCALLVHHSCLWRLSPLRERKTANSIILVMNLLLYFGSGSETQRSRRRSSKSILVSPTLKFCPISTAHLFSKTLFLFDELAPTGQTFCSPSVPSTHMSCSHRGYFPPASYKNEWSN